MVLGLMLALLAAVYAYWHFTNDHRVARQAERYLREATGSPVRVGRAHFSLFGGLQLRDVRLFAPADDARSPIIRADIAVMKLNPWGLLEGRLRPTSVDITGLMIPYDVQKGAYEARQLLGAAGKDTGPGGWSLPDELPPINIWPLRIMRTGDELGKAAVEIPLNLALRQAGPHAYGIDWRLIRPGKDPASGYMKYDLVSGQMSDVQGAFPDIGDLAKLLPLRYSQVLRRYDVRGEGIRFKQVADGQAGKLGTHEVEMTGLMLKLPREEGGLELANVCGKVIFDDGGMTLSGITGRIVQAANAEFAVSGRYCGYEPTSPCELDISIRGMALPAQEQVSGTIADVVRDIRTAYQPSGKCSLSGRLQRLPDGTMRIGGTLEPEDMSISYMYFPYKLTNVRGRLVLADGAMSIKDVTGRHGPARLTITGTASADGRTYDINTDAINVPFDDDLREAIGTKMAGIWPTINPVGRGSGHVQVTRGQGQTRDRVRVAVRLDGEASMCHEMFPYRVDKLMGEIRIDDSDVAVDSLQGQRGGMSCTLAGTIKGADSKTPDVNMTINAKRFPIDEALSAALGEKARAMLAQLHASGQAMTARATLRQSRGGPLEYDIRADLAGVNYQLESFPYSVTGAGGVVTIASDRLVMEKLDGVHGRSPFRVKGEVLLGGAKPGVDLHVLSEDVPLDDDLFKAIPPAAKRAWERLAPAGKADLAVDYRQGLPGMAAGSDFAVTLRPKGMDLQYQEFPYRFRNVTGTAVITPGRIALDSMHAADGQTAFDVSGAIAYDEASSLANLSLKAANLAIDADLLKALPKTAGSLMDSIKPGGACDLDITDLRMARGPSPNALAGGLASSGTLALRMPARVPSSASAPSTAASAPATQETAPTWSFDGAVALRDARLDVGFGDKTVTGTIKGQWGAGGDGMGVDAEARFESLELAKRKITNISAMLRKSPRGASLRVEDIAARTMGGRLAGEAEVRLVPPLGSAIQLKVNDISLFDLFNAGIDDPAKQVKIEGSMAGTLSLITRPGQQVSQQAAGELYLSKAKTNRAPVVVSPQKVMLVFLPGGTPFNDGVVRYELKGNTLLLKEIYLNASGLSLVGSGRIDTKTEALQMTFLSKVGGSLPRIESLGLLLDQLSRQISEIRVTGTLTKPIVRNVSLGSVEDAIKRLTDPGRED